MSVQGRWRVVETPGYDMAVLGAYILFDQEGGEFALDCLTGSIHGACHGDEAQLDHDEARQRYMETRGYRVVRYPAADVLHDPDEAARSISETAVWWRNHGVR